MAGCAVDVRRLPSMRVRRVALLPPLILGVVSLVAWFRRPSRPAVLSRPWRASSCRPSRPTVLSARRVVLSAPCSSCPRRRCRARHQVTSVARSPPPPRCVARVWGIPLFGTSPRHVSSSRLVIHTSPPPLPGLSAVIPLTVRQLIRMGSMTRRSSATQDPSDGSPVRPHPRLCPRTARLVEPSRCASRLATRRFTAPPESRTVDVGGARRCAMTSEPAECLCTTSRHGSARGDDPTVIRPVARPWILVPELSNPASRPDFSPAN